MSQAAGACVAGLTLPTGMKEARRPEDIDSHAGEYVPLRPAYGSLART
jgi:hypothetical protein